MSDTGPTETGVLTVPQRHALALAAFASLPNDVKNAVYRQAAELPVGANPWDDFEKAVTSQLGPDFDATAFVNGIRGIFHARRSAIDRTDEDFVRIVADGIQDEPSVAKARADKEAIQSAIVNLLTLKNVETSHNVARVKFDHAFHLHDAGIVTDLRPIFDRDGSTIEGFVINHTLKIDYAGAGDDQELYLAVDSFDLDKLEAIVKRARRKQIALRAMAERSKLNLIEN